MLTKLTAVCMIAALLFPGVAIVAPGKTNSRMGQAETTATAPAVTVLTAEEAKEIALRHAGLTAGEVTGLRAEYDRDDGRPEFEVEFRHNGWEYEYEIHAETGRILSWEKDD